MIDKMDELMAAVMADRKDVCLVVTRVASLAGMKAVTEAVSMDNV